MSADLPADAVTAAWASWYSQTYGDDYPDGTEFDSGEMFEAYAAGAARAAAAERARIREYLQNVVASHARQGNDYVLGALLDAIRTLADTAGDPGTPGGTR